MVKNSYEIGDILVLTTKSRPIPKTLKQAVKGGYEVSRIVDIYTDMLDKDELTFINIAPLDSDGLHIPIPLMFMEQMYINFGKADYMELLWQK